jgi:hypothetical protein
MEVDAPVFPNKDEQNQNQAKTTIDRTEMEVDPKSACTPAQQSGAKEEVKEKVEVEVDTNLNRKKQLHHHTPTPTPRATIAGGALTATWATIRQVRVKAGRL